MAEVKHPSEELERLRRLVCECATAIELFAPYLPRPIAANAIGVAKTLRDAAIATGPRPRLN